MANLKRHILLMYNMTFWCFRHMRGKCSELWVMKAKMQNSNAVSKPGHCMLEMGPELEDSYPIPLFLLWCCTGQDCGTHFPKSHQFAQGRGGHGEWELVFFPMLFPPHPMKGVRMMLSSVESKWLSHQKHICMTTGMKQSRFPCSWLWYWEECWASAIWNASDLFFF